MDAEIDRVAALDTRAVGLAQHIAALKVQESELSAANREAADALAAARANVTAAQVQAMAIVADAKARADQMVADAKAVAAKIQADAGNALRLKTELDAVVARLRAVPTA